MVLEIFWLFDIAWVYQAIESRATCMAFHPSTDASVDDMRIGCLSQESDILLIGDTQMYTFIYTQTYLYVYSYIHCTEVLHSSYTMCTNVSPDIYTLRPVTLAVLVYISGTPLMPMV